MDSNQNQAEQTKILIRHTEPQSLDVAPYGQIWKEVGENNVVNIWVQISKFEAEPCWIPITYYFEKNFQELLEDPEFLETIRSLFPLQG
jgi:hypothetical protein